MSQDPQVNGLSSEGAAWDDIRFADKRIAAIEVEYAATVLP
ncbi:hypothetical protein [Actinocrispum wychmicini]|nr:hypothetical protein [Actinocrispum wychmicini]